MKLNFMRTIFGKAEQAFRWLITDDKVEQAVKESETTKELFEKLLPLILIASISGLMIASQFNGKAVAVK